MNNVGRTFRYAVVAVISMLGTLSLCAQNNILASVRCSDGNGKPVSVVTDGAGHYICNLAYTASGAFSQILGINALCQYGEAIGAAADTYLVNCKQTYHLTLSGTGGYKYISACGGHNLGQVTANGYVSNLAGVTLTSSYSWEDCDFNTFSSGSATLSGSC